eukprot:EG_transcript_18130
MYRTSSLIGMADRPDHPLPLNDGLVGRWYAPAEPDGASSSTFPPQRSVSPRYFHYTDSGVGVRRSAAVPSAQERYAQYRPGASPWRREAVVAGEPLARRTGYPISRAVRHSGSGSPLDRVVEEQQRGIPYVVRESRAADGVRDGKYSGRTTIRREGFDEVVFHQQCGPVDRRATHIEPETHVFSSSSRPVVIQTANVILPERRAITPTRGTTFYHPEEGSYGLVTAPSGQLVYNSPTLGPIAIRSTGPAARVASPAELRPVPADAAGRGWPPYPGPAPAGTGRYVSQASAPSLAVSHRFRG